MAQDITIAGANYPEVPALMIPKTGGGTATFIEESILNTKADLVENPVAGDILISDANGQPVGSGTDITQLLSDVEAGKNAFMLYDFNQSINITIPPVTQDLANTQIPNVDITISDEMAVTWAIAALAKYEVKDSSGRINAFQVCSFSMNGQKTLRLRMMVGGTLSKNAINISGAVLLKHRG